ncbi:MAG: ADP-forming succinate--CoA ligase subunit beta [Proteobacteria bacterium]|nr:ADP-forming succinate--CoA ligase subunit beta [Pseudomonadota bacterium]NIS71332.1 ADP-forming succinate--CoA ligase subunit beta [Pseudomonadota bacterium]
MKVHEYQAKIIFKEFGIPVPDGGMAESPERAREIAASLGKGTIAIKAQVHAGGRGKGGGVRLVGTPSEAEKAAGEILGMRLVTAQTGSGGRVVRKLLVEKGVDIQSEIYLGVTVDRSRRCVVVMSSEAGGVEIEKVAGETPERILTEHVDPGLGFRPFQASRLAFGLNLPPDLIRKAAGIISALYRLFVQMDCSLVEINPLVITSQGELVALDGKINFDDNGLFRHRELEDLRDIHEEEPLEVEASQHNLNYIKLEGNVGCMVNGAGLAMATMDMIKLVGGEPANFLDVGGGATADMVKNGLRIILSDPNVKAILINIFGGILRCDVLAKGLVEAAKEIAIDLPVVIRLEGTNVEEGRRILKESGLNLITAVDMNEAARKVLSVLKTK